MNRTRRAVGVVVGSAVGGDAGTVVAVTGGVYGVDAIPVRWIEPLRVPLPGAIESLRIIVFE